MNMHMDVQHIERRVTDKYVGTYQHLDQWESIGTARVIMGPWQDAATDDDFCEPKVQRGYVEMLEIEDGVSSEDIRRAINATFTQTGCHHDHDCCGCRSYHASSRHLCGNVYKLTITSSRNF